MFVPAMFRESFVVLAFTLTIIHTSAKYLLVQVDRENDETDIDILPNSGKFTNDIS